MDSYWDNFRRMQILPFISWIYLEYPKWKFESECISIKRRLIEIGYYEITAFRDSIFPVLWRYPHSHVHLTSVNWRTDPFSVVLWGFLLRFGRNGVNFNIKITCSYGFGFDRTFNFMFLTPRHSAELILLTNHSIKLSFHSN